MNGLPLRRRLAGQLALAVALVATVVFGATGWFVIERQRESLTRELTLRVLAETRSLATVASSALLRHDPELELHPLVTRIIDDVDELLDVVIVDVDGIVQGHVDLSRIGTPQEPLRSDAKVAVQGDGARAFLDADRLYVERRIEHLGRTIGTLRATVDRGGVERTVAASLRDVALTGTIGTAVGILLVLVLVTRRLRPLGALRAGVQRIGAGDLQTRVELRDRTELGQLAQHVNAMAEGLRVAQDERIRQERIDSELAIAHQIQETLLPRRIPRVEGLDVAAHYSAALEVSGDYYDLFATPERRLFFVTADVSGKGVPGMVVMAMTKVVLRQLAASDASPCSILRRANSMLVSLIPRQMFVTVALGTVDPRDGTVCYSSAGHCAPWSFGNGASEEISTRGKPLGIFPPAVFDASVKDQTFHLEADRSLLFYTDGLTEAEAPTGAQLGEEAVGAILSRCEGTADESVAALVDRVEDHRAGRAPNDDLTLLVVKRTASSTVEAT